MTTRSSAHLTFLFVMDAASKLDLEFDTSMSLMSEAIMRGHHVFYAEPKHLTLTNGQLNADCREVVSVSRKRGLNFYGKTRLAVSDCDAVLIRKDPPVDLEYIYMTHLLEYAPKHVLMINSPHAIRSANEKLFCFQFPKWMPPSLATSSAEHILRFQAAVASDLILKPLNRKGGEGIFLLRRNERAKTAVIRRATYNGTETILAQKFLTAGLREGDKRILLWDGEILGAFGRVPKKGEFRANMALGGRSKKVPVTRREVNIVRALKPRLKREGLVFVGLDFVGGYLTEINVTSPAGITDINHLYGTRLEERVLDWFEKRLG